MTSYRHSGHWAIGVGRLPSATAPRPKLRGPQAAFAGGGYAATVARKLDQARQTGLDPDTGEPLSAEERVQLGLPPMGGGE